MSITICISNVSPLSVYNKNNTIYTSEKKARKKPSAGLRDILFCRIYTFHRRRRNRTSTQVITLEVYRIRAILYVVFTTE